MTLTLDEAILIGSMLVKRTRGPSEVRGKGCALQMAALAVGREDLAYSRNHLFGFIRPAHRELAELFGVNHDVITRVWVLNDWHGTDIEKIAATVRELTQNEESRACNPALNS